MDGCIGPIWQVSSLSLGCAAGSSSAPAFFFLQGQAKHSNTQCPLVLWPAKAQKIETTLILFNMAVGQELI